jgi:uncharacterized membrane protein
MSRGAFDLPTDATEGSASSMSSPEFEGQRVQRVARAVLLIGVSLAGVLMAGGVALAVAEGDLAVFGSAGVPWHSGMTLAEPGATPSLLVLLGVFVMIGTPVSRAALAVARFHRSRDRLLLALGALVLLVVVLSTLFGLAV